MQNEEEYSQVNGQKKKDKKTSIELQNIIVHRKLKIEQHKPHKNWGWIQVFWNSTLITYM